MIKQLTTLAVIGALGLGSVQAAVVTFDAPGLIDIDPVSNVATYSEAGYNFKGDAATFLQLDGVGSGGSPGLYGLANNVLGLTRATVGLFNLASLDFGSGDGQVAAPATSLLVQGLQSDNTLLSQLLNLGALSSFNFSGWNGLASVSFSANGDFVLDNLALQAVPEPAAWALVALALAGMAGVTRHRRAKLR